MHDTRYRFVLFVFLSVTCVSSLRAEEIETDGLPFDRERINRYSLDHLPRSISIRQGDDVWLGYDLPRATIYKVWRAPAGEAGLKQTGFVMRSVGNTLYEDRSDEPWKLRRSGETVLLAIRYLGCSQRRGYFELRWELSHDADIVTLRERVPKTAGNETAVTREVQVDSLPPKAQLLFPLPAQRRWNLMTADGRPASSLGDSQWYRLTPR